MKNTRKERIKKGNTKKSFKKLWKVFQKNAGPIGTVVAIFALLLTWGNYHVSISASVKQEQERQALAQERLALEQEKQPSFAWDEKLTGADNHYIIRNTGGDIRDGSLSFDPVCEIRIFDDRAQEMGTLLWDRYSEIIRVPYDFERDWFEVFGEESPEPVARWEEIIQNAVHEEGYYCLVNWTQRYRIQYRDYKQEGKSRELIARGGELYDFKDGEKNGYRLWLEMNESGERLLDSLVRSGIESLQRKQEV